MTARYVLERTLPDGKVKTQGPIRSRCGASCAACWIEAHRGHDIGMRHEDGRLFSATCHDCDTHYRREEVTND